MNSVDVGEQIKAALDPIIQAAWTNKILVGGSINVCVWDTKLNIWATKVIATFWHKNDGEPGTTMDVIGPSPSRPPMQPVASITAIEILPEKIEDKSTWGTDVCTCCGGVRFQRTGTCKTCLNCGTPSGGCS